MQSPESDAGKSQSGPNDWGAPPEEGIKVAAAGGAAGRGQKGIASMGALNANRVPAQMQETVSAFLGQLEAQSAQPRKDNVVPAIIAAAVLLASALYPLLRPVVALFSKEAAVSRQRDEQDVDPRKRTRERLAASLYGHDPVARATEDPFDRPPHAQWPGNAAVAFAVVVWLDEAPETDYGIRYGFWRLLAALTKHDLRATLLASPALLGRCPEIVRAVRHHGWEIALHVDEPSELSSSQLLSRCTALAHAFQEAVSEGPRGFYLSGHQRSTYLRTEILSKLGLTYDARGEGDLPWRLPHLVVPSSPWFARREGQLLDSEGAVAKNGGAGGHGMARGAGESGMLDCGRARVCAEDRAAALGKVLSALLAEGGFCEQCRGSCSCAAASQQAALLQSYAASAAALGRERDGAGGGSRDEGRARASDSRPKMLVLDLWCGLDGLPAVCNVWDEQLARISELGSRGHVWRATKVCCGGAVLCGLARHAHGHAWMPAAVAPARAQLPTATRPPLSTCRFRQGKLVLTTILLPLYLSASLPLALPSHPCPCASLASPLLCVAGRHRRPLESRAPAVFAHGLFFRPQGAAANRRSLMMRGAEPAHFECECAVCSYFPSTSVAAASHNASCECRAQHACNRPLSI